MTVPKSLAELEERVAALVGRTLEDIAQAHGQLVPANLLRQKGWVGMLLEKALGCTAGSLPIADFPELGVELKTLPLNSKYKIKESTYICVVPLKNLTQVRFSNSLLWEKLRCILWVPIEADASIPIGQRRVLNSLLWEPNAVQRSQLERDFNEHMELIAMGQIESISAHAGEVLQIRPKAANAKQLTEAMGPDGQMIQTLPRGFYLRPSFTQAMIDGAYQ